MLKQAYLPITEAGEVRAFLRGLPIAVDADGFTRFVLGFPHRYLTQTSPVEFVRHYALVRALGGRGVISSVAREAALWKLCLVARDRKFLFSRIAGALSCFGMDILHAEAFANANAVVLDTFLFADREAHLENDAQRRRFQSFLENVVEGKADLDAAMAESGRQPTEVDAPLQVSWEEDAHPTATLMVVEGSDRFGLLYQVSRAIAARGVDIEMAYIDTQAGCVRDEFYLTRTGGRLDDAMQSELADVISKGSSRRDEPDQEAAPSVS